jgi:3-deoxy-D-manno-octulosonic-acid transferase
LRALMVLFVAHAHYMYFLYTCLTAAGVIVLLPYFAIQRWRRGKHFHGLRERLGFLPESVHTHLGTVAGEGTGTPAGGSIWLHAVSVGEVLAVTALARKLAERFPGRRLLVSTTTPAGQALARERLAFADAIFYFPLDQPGPVRRAFDAVAPAIVVVVETEIWPNFLREARRRGVPVVFVNGRISERSYTRTRRWQPLAGGFFQRVLADARLFLMQSDADLRRLLDLGADPSRVVLTGNLKYDVPPPAPGPLVAWLELQAQARRPLLVAGSVVAGEEEAVLTAFAAVRQKSPCALLILAPRKPERFEAAAYIIVGHGVGILRRSKMDFSQRLGEQTAVLLLDSVGELAGLYQLADLVFVGGSLVPAGGHNILEPAWFGKAPFFGAHMENFCDMARLFVESGAGQEVGSAEDLGRRWMELLENPAKREEMGRAARLLVERNQGATERTLQHLTAILADERGQM